MVKKILESLKLKMNEKFEVTYKSVLIFVSVLLGIWFLYYIRDILFQLLVAFVIIASFEPYIAKFERRKVPRTLGVIIVYFVFLSVVSFSIYILAPALVYETGNFVTNIPDYINKITLPSGFKDQILQQFLVQLGQLPSQLAKTAISVSSNVLNVVMVLILSFYMLLSREKIDRSIRTWLGNIRAEKVIDLIGKIENNIGNWAKGELLLMLIVGLLNFVGLEILRVPYALPLAILAGLLEIVPMVGPFVAAVPAVIIGFGQSFFVGVGVAALAFLVQHLENYIIVPNIMRKSVGLDPVVTLVALSVGFRIHGVAGAIIAIPVVLGIQVVIRECILSKNYKDKSSPM